MVRTKPTLGVRRGADRVVSRCRYCKSVGAEHCLTSAKLNKNVAEAFVALTRSMPS